MKSPITTHVLDTARGRPAAGIAVTLARQSDDGAWTDLTRSETNADGRIGDLLDRALRPGVYRLIFETGAYLGDGAFYPEVAVVFEVADPDEHYHVPLLLSPYGYSTYRGS